MTTFAFSSGKKVRLEQVALVHFLANGTDAQIKYRNGSSETVSSDLSAFKTSMDNGFYNYNGIDAQGPDSTYINTRVNQSAVLSAEQTDVGQVTAIVEGVGAVVQNRGADYIDSMMGIIA